LFEGAGGDLTQVHDFNPGIAPSGLFWTIPIPRNAVTANAGAGTGEYHQSGLAIPDFHDFGNSVSPSPTSIPGHASFDVTWSGNGDHKTIRDETFGFEGSFVGGSSAISFTASDDGTGVTYTSDAEGQVTVGAVIGTEQNGVFFS
jgi:hypothetical protein